MGKMEKLQEEMMKKIKETLRLGAGKKLDQLTMESVLKIPVSQSQDNDGKEGPFGYFDVEESCFILNSGTGGKAVFTPSFDMTSAWMVVKMMANVMEEQASFRWDGPLFNPIPGRTAPYGGKFEKKCWYIFIMYSGMPLLIEDDSPMVAICKAGYCVRILSDFFAERKKPPRIHKIK